MKQNLGHLGGLVGDIKIEDIHYCYFIRFGSILFSNDGFFIVFERTRDVVVLSDFDITVKMQHPFLLSLIERRRLFSGYAWLPPIAWRRRILGILPGFSVGSGIYPKYQLDAAKLKWRLVLAGNIEEVSNGTAG